MCMWFTCRPQICQVFSSHDTLEAYQLVDDDLGRLVQWTLEARRTNHAGVVCCWSCIIWMMDQYWPYLIHDCGFQQGTLGGPLYLYACLRSEWWHRHALSWFQQHSSMAGLLCWWVRDVDDEVCFLKPDIYLFWSGAGSGFWYRRCLLLSLVQIGRLQQKRGLGIRDDYGVHKCF